MGNSNQYILAKLDQAFKDIIDPSALDKSILAKEKFDRFVHAMQHRTTILDEARFIGMNSHTTHIDRVGFVGRILRSGGEVSDGSQGHKELDSGDYAKPQFNTNELIAREMQAVCSIRDTALRRNIEREGFEDTLVDLFGEAAGRDFEEFAILADTDISHGEDDVLSLTDGWAELAANKVYGGSNGEFDPSDKDWPENMFQAMLKALPSQFLQNRSEWRYYVDFETEDAYRNLLKARGTALGDNAQTEDAQFRYKGIPVAYCPLIERAKDTGELGGEGPGRIAMLQHPDNLVWGVFHEVTIEPERVPKARRTDFVLTIEADAHYEDENAGVTAYIDKDKPAS